MTDGLRRGRPTPFTMLPDTFFGLRGFTASEKLVYLYLYHCASRADRTAFPSYQTIADALEITRKTAMHAVARLVERGLLQKEHRKTDAGDYTSNWYVIWEPDDALPESGSSESSRPGDLPGGEKITPPLAVAKLDPYRGEKSSPPVRKLGDHPPEKIDPESPATPALAGSAPDPNQMYLEPDPLNQRVGDDRAPARACEDPAKSPDTSDTPLASTSCPASPDPVAAHERTTDPASAPGVASDPSPKASPPLTADPDPSSSAIPPESVLNAVAAALDRVVLGPRDLTAVRECWALAAADPDRFQAVLETARSQFHPQFPGDRIRSAQYFVPAFAREAAARAAWTAPLAESTGPAARIARAQALPAGVDPETGLDADGNPVVAYTPRSGINLSKRNRAFLDAWLRKHPDPVPEGGRA